VFVCVATLPVLSEWTTPKRLWMWVFYIFIALEINILYRNVSILYRNVYILYIQYIYTLQVHMSTSCIGIHYTGWGYQSPNPIEIHRFKWEFCVRFARHFSGT
jgi:hypothetical protein